MNYYERHIGDYLKDTAHLSLLEHGIYSRLLDVYYTREGAIPVGQVERLIGVRSKDEKAALANVLDEFFVLDGDVLKHSRCEREIARYQDKQRKAKASAEARWNAQRPQSDGNANAMRTHSEGNALQSPVTRHQTPDTSYSEAKASGGKPPTDAERVWANGVPLLTAAGVKESNARSMLGGLCKTHGAELVADAIERCATEGPVAPVAWLQAALASKGRPNAQEALERQNRAVAQRFLERA